MCRQKAPPREADDPQRLMKIEPSDALLRVEGWIDAHAQIHPPSAI
jgi:hypothetical protein